MKRWECTVCGYIHEGDEPPEECPICGADRSKFVEIPSETSDPMDTEIVDKEKQASTPILKSNKLFEQMIKHHLHPILVHIPNGVLPVTIIFVILAAIFNFTGLSQAAFYNLVFVVLSMPLVLFTGYIEWQIKYKAARTKLFIIKIVSGIFVAVTATVLAIWLFIDPEVVTASSPSRISFILINFIMLGGVSVAGFIGGKLVFKD